MTDITAVCIGPDATIREAMLCINQNRKGIALVVDHDRRLMFTITDGDLRRAVLQGLDLQMTVQQLARRRAERGQLDPVTASLGTPAAELLRMMGGGLRHVPILDEQGRVVELAFLNDLIANPERSLRAVVMAGGFGTRLRPLTTDLPKPMLPVGNRPVIEHIVTQLRDSGVSRVSITTHYKPEAIKQHLGNGQKFGVDIDYLNEDHPLGTAGALSLMQNCDAPFLVINGDILTKLNYVSMQVFHEETQAIMTVAVRQYDMQVPYGVVETSGVDIRKLSEKPTLQFFVNAGVYLLEPRVREYIKYGETLDMPDLISRLVQGKQRVVSFPISEYWLDVGHHADYQKAQLDYETGKA